MTTLARRLAAEGLGTGLLVCAVIGSGIMADSLTGDDAVALLANTLATGAVLAVLVALLRSVSGAHLNPAVSLVFALRGEVKISDAWLYSGVQITGAMCGTLLAHAMYGLPLLGTSQHVRAGAPQWLAEGVATFGLIMVILASLKVQRVALPWLVALYIVGAYWFTASTSFANPAVTLGRAFTDTFAGIRPIDAPAFMIAQILGALCGAAFASWLWADPRTAPTSAS